MPDHAHSTDPAVQAQLDRLWSLSPGADILGLDRITALLARVGDPHLHLPPVFHVAGTNGKGSTCAFLRAVLEGAGHRVHVYTSPHLVRFNERIRLAGRLIDDAALAPLLAEVLDAGGDLGASFFEVTTAAAFLAFARTPADACVIEVGLGGRLDATNVLPTPAICGIAALGIDHERFLLAEEAGTPADPLDRIGFEKAGIAKAGVPLVTDAYPRSVRATVAAVAAARGAPLLPRGDAWEIAPAGSGNLRYRDRSGELALPSPRMAGEHQASNAGLAVAMLRHQGAVAVGAGAMATGIGTAHWPARLQRLRPGPLANLLPPGTPLLVDGGHNPSAGAALRIALEREGVKPLAVVIGLLANKDGSGFLAPFAPLVDRLVAVPIVSHDHHPPDALAGAARALGIADVGAAGNLPQALGTLRNWRGTVLIAGSLYLAGEALALNDEAPV